MSSRERGGLAQLWGQESPQGSLRVVGMLSALGFFSEAPHSSAPAGFWGLQGSLPHLSISCFAGSPSGHCMITGAALWPLVTALTALASRHSKR